jgi:hypothetical protein
MAVPLSPDECQEIRHKWVAVVERGALESEGAIQVTLDEPPPVRGWQEIDAEHYSYCVLPGGVVPEGAKCGGLWDPLSVGDSKMPGLDLGELQHRPQGGTGQGSGLPEELLAVSPV